MTHAQDNADMPMDRDGPARGADPRRQGDPWRDEPVRRDEPVHRTGVKRTRISGAWIAVLIALFVLALLLVFILQNLGTVTVHFLGMTGSMPLAVAMLFSAIAGAALVALVGAARIFQLRKQAKKAPTTIR
jgi:uncharacterized integral membrane protein